MNNKKIFFGRSFCLLTLGSTLILHACGGSSNSATGGSEFGNPSRGLIGTVTTASALAKSATTCPVDSIIATDSLAVATEAILGSDCSFDMMLESGKAYSIGFVSGDEFVASLIVNNGVGETSVIFVSEGESDIDLGLIEINGDVATPSNEPYQQTDLDGDGVSDFEDEDDDDDGQDDDEEEDCDDDGFEDDEDESDSCDGEDDSGDDEDGGSGGGGDEEEDDDEDGEEEEEEE